MTSPNHNWNVIMLAYLQHIMIFLFIERKMKILATKVSIFQCFPKSLNHPPSPPHGLLPPFLPPAVQWIVLVMKKYNSVNSFLTQLFCIFSSFWPGYNSSVWLGFYSIFSIDYNNKNPWRTKTLVYNTISSRQF